VKRNVFSCLLKEAREVAVVTPHGAMSFGITVLCRTIMKGLITMEHH